MNLSIKNNAALRSKRAVTLPGSGGSWGGANKGIRDTASAATKKRLREQYLAELQHDRRRQLMGTIIGLLVAIFLLYLLL